MILCIGWPEKYPVLYIPTLHTDNLLYNIYALSSSQTFKNVELLNKKSKPGVTWNEPNYIVNAFYYNEINEFVIPAGILMYPFFEVKEKEKERSIGCGCGWLWLSITLPVERAVTCSVVFPLFLLLLLLLLDCSSSTSSFSLVVSLAADAAVCCLGGSFGGCIGIMGHSWLRRPKIPI